MSEVRWRAGKTHTSRHRAKPCSNQGDGYNSRTVKGDCASTNLTFMKGRQKAGSGAWGWVGERSGTTHRLGLSGMLERLSDRIGTDQPIAAVLVPPAPFFLLPPPTNSSVFSVFSSTPNLASLRCSENKFVLWILPNPPRDLLALSLGPNETLCRKSPPLPTRPLHSPHPLPPSPTETRGSRRGLIAKSAGAKLPRELLPLPPPIPISRCAHHTTRKTSLTF